MSPDGDGRSERYPALDALRGLAAATVVLHHFLVVSPEWWDESYHSDFWVLKYTPLHVFWAGPEAVMLFFVLSGFVLSLPFYRGRVSVKRFLTRRVFRIYPAYVVAVLLAVALAATISRHGISSLSGWFNLVWIAPVSAADVVRAVLLIDVFDPIRMDPPFWSLVHEMRISLLFPILMIVVRRERWWVVLPFAAGLSAVGYAFSADSDITGSFHTMRYVVLFVVGALVAKHRQSLAASYKRLPSALKWLGGALALITYTWVYWAGPTYSPGLTKLEAQWTAGIGSCVIVALVLFEPRLDQPLRWGPLQFLGRISYSLYLVHVPLLMASIYLLHAILPIWAILLVAGALVLGVATSVHRWVELPGIRAGQTLGHRKRPAQDELREAA